MKLNENVVNCILCGGSCITIIELPGSEIKERLSSLFGDNEINSINIEDYHLLHCRDCELEFAYPQVPGSNEFYEWIVKNKSYYPASRWEWSEVISILNSLSKAQENTLTVLDVGCGAGAFLERLIGMEKFRGVGIDLTESSVQECHARGIEAYCCELSGVRKKLDDGIDVVTAFHVLEHVPNPVKFLEEIGQLLKPGGYALISTPFSPMSIEENWFDPLNHPPHHLTRWNEKSYAALAKRIGMEIEFFLPKEVGLFRRIISAINIKVTSPFIPITPSARKFRLIAYLFMHPLSVLNEVTGQIERRRFENKVAPDSILVRFTKVVAS